MMRALALSLVIVAGTASLGCSTASAAGPDRGVTYAGRTSHHDPIVFKLSGDGKRVVKMVDMWDAPCTAGGSVPLGFPIKAALPIDNHGNFTWTSSHGVTVSKDATWYLDQHAEGRVSGHRLSGTWQIDLRRWDATGTLVDRCATSFTFKATAAKRRVLGGQTSQGLPVVLRIAPGMHKVRTIDLGWESDCTSGDLLQLSNRLLNFRIADGRFGGVASLRDSSDGEQFRLSFTVRGRLSSARAVGKLRGDLTVRDASGKLEFECDSRSISYAASSG